jgi:hypothetical protein
METAHSSEMLLDFQYIAWCYIPEDGLFVTTAVRTPNPDYSI